MLTLEIQRKALARGMSLKDASAFNVQFLGGRPVFIDTLSFEAYREGTPWVAYRQFCRHFVAPLALMARVDVRLNQLFRPSLEGIPLDLASRMLPWRTRLSPGLLIHLHLHAGAERAYSSDPVVSKPQAFSRSALLGLIDSLEGTIRAQSLGAEGDGVGRVLRRDQLHRRGDLLGSSHWSASSSTRSDPGRSGTWAPTPVAIAGLAGDRGASTVAFDVDPACVELHLPRRRSPGGIGRSCRSGST